MGGTNRHIAAINERVDELQAQLDADTYALDERLKGVEGVVPRLDGLERGVKANYQECFDQGLWDTRHINALERGLREVSEILAGILSGYHDTKWLPWAERVLKEAEEG